MLHLKPCWEAAVGHRCRNNRCRPQMPGIFKRNHPIDIYRCVENMSLHIVHISGRDQSLWKIQSTVTEKPCPQVPQEQLEPVLRVASQLKIRGLDSDYSRESSLEPDRWNFEYSRCWNVVSKYCCHRPGSQQSGSSKRKNSPKFHFLKNRRKNLVPAKREREEKEDDNASLNVSSFLFKTFTFLSFLKQLLFICPSFKQ